MWLLLVAPLYDGYSSHMFLLLTLSYSQLMELADCIEEVRSTCHFCNKKAVLNLKHVNGRADTTGPG